MYVRFRGRVTGPFSDEQIRQLLEQRRLSAFHEVSADGVNWQSAPEAGLMERPGGPAPAMPDVKLPARPEPTPAPVAKPVVRGVRVPQPSSVWRYVLLLGLLMTGFLLTAGAVIVLMTIHGQGGPPEGSFQALAKEKQQAIAQYLEVKGPTSRAGMKNFQWEIQGKEGRLKFVDWSEVVQKEGTLKSNIAWKVSYSWKDNRWIYQGSQREMFNAKFEPLGFQPAEDSPKSTDKGVVRILRQGHEKPQ
jgi:hypothetical protein